MASTHRLAAEVSLLFERDSAGALPPLRPQRPYSAEAKSAIADSTLAIPVRGALHLLNDDLDAAHNLVQTDEGTPLSDLVHAVLHRREGDFWNSKWWLDRISPALLTTLYANGRAGAKRFVDDVERITSKGTATACAAQRDVADAKEWQWKELVSIAKHACKEYNVELP